VLVEVARVEEVGLPGKVAVEAGAVKEF